jgi:aspartyl-tRNA(Asn)/glutamyl-tRNA(Gln) amidotransferase subunit C
MKIEDLQETAALAHLNLDEGELAGAFPAFEQMLGYFAAMEAADQDEVFPAEYAAVSAGAAAVSGTVASDHFRPDTAGFNAAPDSQGLNESLLTNAGDRDGRFIVVPNVL